MERFKLHVREGCHRHMVISRDIVKRLMKQVKKEGEGKEETKERRLIGIDGKKEDDGEQQTRERSQESVETLPSFS